MSAAQAPAVGDEWRQGAQGGALGAQGRKLGPVCAEQCALEWAAGGASWAWLGGNAARYVAPVSGGTGKSTRNA